MAGQINLELLIRVAAEQAKRELGAVTTGAKALTAAADQLGSTANTTGGQLETITAGASNAAQAMRQTAAGTATSVSELASFTATAGRAATAVAGVRDSVTGLTRNLAAQTLEMLEARREGEAWQATLDGIRARYNPLFAVSRQYEQELRDIAEAERMGAISAMEAAAARDRAAQSMAPVNAGLRDQVQASGMATAANANLIAQWNDIGMMIAAGQSPMMLALQQGTQVSQVLNQMGGSGTTVLRTLGTSFLGLLSPINLATIGIIGFGAAGVQAFIQLWPQAKTLEERMNALNEAFERYKSISAVIGLSSDDMARQFGEGAAAAQGLYAVLSGLSKLALDEQLKKTGTAARDMIGMGAADQFLARSGSNMTDFFGLGSGASQVRRYSSDISSFDSALQGFEEAKGIDAQTAAMQKLLERVQYLATLKGGISDQEQALIDLLKEQADVLLGIQSIETAAKERGKREGTAITRELTQQAELSRTMLAFGKNSAQVEALRTSHAREALQLRLQEANIAKGSKEEADALAAFDADQLAARALADQERRRASGEIVADLQQQLAVTSAIAIHGEDSAQVEALRAKYARDALAARLEELGAAPGLVAFAVKLMEADQERAAAIKEAEKARQFTDMLGELQNEAALNRAILTYGRDSLQVKELQIAAERRAYAQQVEAMDRSREQKDLLMQQWEIARGIAGADPFGTLAAGQEMMRAQSDRVTQLRLELSLAGQNELVRARTLALYRAEQEIRERGIDATSELADKLRAGALEEASLEARLDRISDAWGRVDGAASSAIDKMVDGLTGGGSDALRGAAQDFLNLFKELAITNPLKNMILGQNLPELSDVGGLGGIWGRLTGKKDPASGLSVSAMNPASMAVTTPMVTLSAGTVAGLPPGAIAGMALPGGGSAPAGLARAIAPGAVLPGSTDIQSQIWAFFQGKGLQPHQIAGIMGNVAAESSFNPLAVGDNGAAHGLFQWNDRAPKLFDFIGGQQNLGNIQAQLEFAWKELMTSENGAFKQLMASTNVYDATHAVAGFERPWGYSASNPQSADGWDRRLAGAEAALAKFEGTSVSAQTQLQTLGTGAQQLGTGMQQLGAGLAGTLQGIGANYGPGGAFIGGLLGEGLKWMLGAGASPKPAGFYAGGWTGPGATTDVAGVVHAEEYVFDAAATRKIGVANLEALRRGALKGYREGGYVVGTRPPPSVSALTGGAGASSGAAGGGRDREVTMNLNVTGTGTREVQEGVRMAIEAALEEYDRQALPGRVRAVVNDRWGE